jgi:hypothetical protein
MKMYLELILDCAIALTMIQEKNYVTSTRIRGLIIGSREVILLKTVDVTI